MIAEWIILELVVLVILIVCRHTIKRCEAEMVNALQHVPRMVKEDIEEIWPDKMAEVEEKLLEQHSNVILKLRKETAGMKEWVEKRLTGTADTVKAILDQADAKIKIADDNIKIANGIINKPAELKLTVNFRGQK